MNRNTLPIPRDQNQTIPSFRELDHDFEARMLEDQLRRLPRGNDHAVDSLALPNQYPPYPARGFEMTADPSHNAFRSPGFVSRGVITGELQVGLETSDMRSLQIPGNQLLVRPRPSQRSIGTQTPFSPRQPSQQKRKAPNDMESYPGPSKKPTTSPFTPTELSALPRPIQQPYPNLPTRTNPAEEPIQRPETIPNNRAHLQKIRVQFAEVAAHTAKCDQCNRRNQCGMSRCKVCGWQICNKCKNDRGGDRSHASFKNVHVPDNGGDVPLDGAQDAQPSCGSPELRAAESLVKLAAEASGVYVQNIGIEDQVKSGLGPLYGRELPELTDEWSTCSESISMTEDEWPEEDVQLSSVCEHGSLIGYILARRNPVRAARPAAKMSE